jgi:shikimate dehydrogenase
MPTVRAAVLGAPIAHSLSPALHRAAYAALGIDGSYDPVEVGEQELPAFLDGLGPEWVGLSLTMPLKYAVLPLLDEVAPDAVRVGAVNTVVLRPRGHVRPHRSGHNTDIPGMVAALGEAGVRRVASATVVGGGATARSAVAALGAITDRVEAVVRTPARAAALVRTGSVYGVQVTLRGWDAAAEALRAPLVVATTPAGATDTLAADVPAGPGVLFDVLYAPWPTPLAVAWSASGGAVVGGLDLLVHQAARQVPLMTGRGEPSGLVPVMRRAIGAH